MTNDAQLIADLGGPAKVAELLGFNKHGGIQRVQNWIARGIPYKVKVDHAKVFSRQKAKLQAAQPAATA